MESKLVEKAKSRLRIAQKALGDLKTATSHQEFSDTWYTFLMAAKNVYTSLEQASKDAPQCRQWFGAVKSVRKSDELLQYLFQARDDEEHGVEAATELQPESIAIGVSKPGFSSSMHITALNIDRGTIHLDATSHDGKPILIEVSPAQTILKYVTGRGNVKYNPPTSHLGIPLTSGNPIEVAELGLIYLSGLVTDAGKRT
jgi:hypothetical protein